MASKSQILIVGGAVAGASTAIRLAEAGVSVTLVEREKFPRHKLCGEFVSPECLAHFARLGVSDAMLSRGGDAISETVFFAPGGKSVVVPSQWFLHGGNGALGLSRAEMDFHLLERAKDIGVKVFEETQVVGLLLDNSAVQGIKAKTRGGEVFEIESSLTIDATGRAAVLGKLFEKEKSREGSVAQRKGEKQKSKFIAFKAHLENARIEHGRCEIYFYDRGYGGLNWVENNAANCCFIVAASAVKRFGNDAGTIWRETILKNKRAFEAMENAAPIFDWLAVSIDGFGRKTIQPAANVLAIGDAAAFVDPFTGSGMLMALESGEAVAAAILNNISALQIGETSQIATEYCASHAALFNRRLRVSAFLRRAAFAPNLAAAAIQILSFSSAARQLLARATRSTASNER
jgi:flavin-dependent dehydrogenase